MKKTSFVFAILFFLSTNFFVVPNFCCAFEKETQNYSFEIQSKHKTFYFETSELLNNQKLSFTQQEIIKNQNRLNVLKQIEDFGLTKKEKLLYIFPELKEILKILKSEVNSKEIKPDVQVVLNSCKINFIEGVEGVFFDEQNFLENFEQEVLKNKKKVKLKLVEKKDRNERTLKRDFVEKSVFETKFASSSKERKHNIKKALACFDGFVLNEGECLSFNQTTGVRNEQNGYKQAKIISGGSFVDGFGGGVCQVSTTLYNACLLASLEIVEVHQHSLPVGYVEPSFDAMVNSGSSDLIVKNNTGGKLIFTTSSKNDVCKVKIFGKPNKFKIERVSEKTKTIPSVGDVFETDLKKFNVEKLEKDEQKRISFPKDGYESKGYIKLFKPDGSLFETKKIREDSYAPVKGVILKSA